MTPTPPIDEQQRQSDPVSAPQSLYRRHRPRTFADVVGQEPVVRTLSNAVERGKVHHAYLFVGSRGTGKTSMAKILAACLNCERGPTVEPCGVCDSCRSIARANSLDVIEMDAASNNSVDDIRELRESVAYAPVSGRRKVYILDEAHMLSTAAWNAFLKTLEEPPPNTLFVLATTEAQKVPATVIDRCHRFDFQRPTVAQIVSVLERTAAEESIEIPRQALAAVARSATGSFRDALGTLEQLVTYSGAVIALEDVLAVLGVADGQLLEETVEAVAAGDSRRALQMVERCAQQGRDATSFLSDLEHRARELMVVQTLGEVPSELSLTADADASLAAQAERTDPATVLRLLELLGSAREGVRAGSDARTRLELALVKASRPALDSSTAALLARIEHLEGPRATASGIAPQPPATQVSPGAPGAPGPSLASPGAPGAPGPSLASPGAPGAPGPSLASPGAPTSPVAAGHEAGAIGDPTPESPPASTPPVAPSAAAPTPTAPAAPLAPAPPAPESAAAPRPPGLAPESSPASTPPAPESVAAPTPTAPALASPAAPGGEPPIGEAPDLESLVGLWPGVVELVVAEHALCGAVIMDARPVELVGDELTVGFPSSAAFLKRQAEDPDNRAIVSEAVRRLTGRRVRLAYELREELDDGAPGGAQGQGAGITEEQVLDRLKEEFDAQEIPIASEAGPVAVSEQGE